MISGGAPGTHHIEGGGAGFWPPQLEQDDFDEVQTVTTDDAVEMARHAAREHGIFSGPRQGPTLSSRDDSRPVLVLVLVLPRSRSTPA